VEQMAREAVALAGSLAEQQESKSAGYGEMEFNLVGVAPGCYILVVVSGGERYTLPIFKL